MKSYICKVMIVCLIVWGSTVSLAGVEDPVLPDPAPIPTVPAPQPVGTVPMGNPADFPRRSIWIFRCQQGLFEPTWGSINQNAPAYPRLAAGRQIRLLGTFRPAVPRHERRLVCTAPVYAGPNCLQQPHPGFWTSSQTGYMDVLHAWNPTQLDPAAYVQALS